MNPVESRNPLIGVVAPVFNEAEGIASTVNQWAALLIDLLHETELFEIVLCDDCSTDSTEQVLNDLSQLHDNLVIIRHDVNQGAGSALRSAIKESRAEWLILIDSDGQFDLTDALKVWKVIATGDLCAGIGFRKKNDKRSLVIGSAISGHLANWIFGSKLRDFNCALKVVPGELCRNFRLETTRYNYSTEMTARLLDSKISLVQFPTRHLPRTQGSSGAKLIRDGVNRLWFLLYLFARQHLLEKNAISLETYRNL